VGIVIGAFKKVADEAGGTSPRDDYASEIGMLKRTVPLLTRTIADHLDSLSDETLKALTELADI
jgi:hypothetical protein